jgi:CheY-like chemotaxis protein
MVYTPPTILIVDDDQAICELVSEGLIEDGYICDIALTANEALTKLQNHRFDIALLDINLPGKSGMELLRTSDALFQNTEIIMMTAVKDLETAVQAMKLGASDYVVKPFTRQVKCHIGTAESKSITDLRGFSETGNYMRLIIGPRQSMPSLRSDAQVDYFDFHSKIVTEKTIDVAVQLCVPPKEIEKWAVARNELYSERDRYLKAALSKLERNPVAQVMLGLTYSVYGCPNLNGKRNLGDIGHGTHDS